MGRFCSVTRSFLVPCCGSLPRVNEVLSLGRATDFSPFLSGRDPAASLGGEGIGGCAVVVKKRFWGQGWPGLAWR